MGDGLEHAYVVDDLEFILVAAALRLNVLVVAFEPSIQAVYLESISLMTTLGPNILVLWVSTLPFMFGFQYHSIL
jgi:hypothetical protein